MPMLIVNLILPPSYYDVNLSTDKKQILLMKENVMLAAFQEIYRYVIDASNANMRVSSVNQKKSQNVPMVKRVRDTDPIAKEATPDSKARAFSQADEKKRGLEEAALITPSIQQAVDVLFRPSPTQSSRSAMKVSQSDVRVSQSDMRVSQSDVRVSQSDVKVSQSDVRVSQSDARVSQSDVRVSQSDVSPSNPVVTPVKGSNPTPITPSNPTPITHSPPTITPLPSSPLATNSHPVLTEIKDTIPVVVDRCRRSKKRHDPLLLTPVKKREDSLVLSQTPPSHGTTTDSPRLDLKQPIEKPHTIFTRTPSNDLSQNTNVSFASIVQRFQTLAAQSPSLLSLSSSPLFPDSQSFVRSDFAGETVPSQFAAEQELTRILQKVGIVRESEE